MANKSYIRKTINDFKKYCNHRYPDNAELSALWDYVAGYTTSLNDILRYYSIPDDISKVSNSVINETVKESITNLDNAFNSEFASTGIIDVFRTIDKEALEKAYGITEDNIDDYIGRVISDCGYMSTSSECISPWSGEAKWMDNEVVLHITSTIPMNYLDINKIFRNSEIDCNEQKEYLLQRNLKLEIKSYTCRSGVVKYDKKKCICFIEVQIVNRKISESKNMKNTKKALYESIMMAVAKEVKKALNESSKS